MKGIGCVDLFYGFFSEKRRNYIRDGFLCKVGKAYSKRDLVVPQTARLGLYIPERHLSESKSAPNWNFHLG